MNGLVNKVINEYDHKAYYNKWLNIIEETFNKTINCIDNAYEVKNKLDNELSYLYIEKLMDYHSYLTKVYRVYVQNISDQPVDIRQHNYNVIAEEINTLANKYMELDDFIMALNFLNEGKKAVEFIPAELQELRSKIEYNL